MHPGSPRFELPFARIPRHQPAERDQSLAPRDDLEQPPARGLDHDPVRCRAVHGIREPVVLEQMQFGNVERRALCESRHGDLRLRCWSSDIVTRPTGASVSAGGCMTLVHLGNATRRPSGFCSPPSRRCTASLPRPLDTAGPAGVIPPSAGRRRTIYDRQACHHAGVRRTRSCAGRARPGGAPPHLGGLLPGSRLRREGGTRPRGGRRPSGSREAFQAAEGTAML